jgi:uncharacterized protein
MIGRHVGLISDTHGLLRSEAVQALQGSDLIIHAGDVGKAAVLSALRQTAPIAAVRGNIDRGVWAQGLPQTQTLEIGLVWVYVIHDLEQLDIVPETAGIKVVVSGHSHHPSIHERNGVVYINPGSAGPRRLTLPVSVARMHVQGESVEVDLVTLEA